MLSLRSEGQAEETFVYCMNMYLCPVACSRCRKRLGVGAFILPNADHCAVPQAALLT